MNIKKIFITFFFHFNRLFHFLIVTSFFIKMFSQYKRLTTYNDEVSLIPETLNELKNKEVRVGKEIIPVDDEQKFQETKKAKELTQKLFKDIKNSIKTDLSPEQMTIQYLTHTVESLMAQVQAQKEFINSTKTKPSNVNEQILYQNYMMIESLKHEIERMYSKQYRLKQMLQQKEKEIQMIQSNDTSNLISENRKLKAENQQLKMYLRKVINVKPKRSTH